MKTKSKRFLNLATLCLALLGTALLMGRPVNAEAIPATREVQQQTAENEDTIRKEYMAFFGLSDSDSLDGDARYKGYVDGYRKGFSGENRTDRSAIEDPYYTALSYEDGEYRDGYEQGFEKGRHESHPVTAFLEDLWGFLTDIFGNWFGGGQQSQ
ncbi:hypothetical protein [Streptococcus pyogenes]|uniref:hypothetical protein n=1 Tax=Streptococcus pyogenes TaxID=1314 RepID=UPI0010A18538|nr:hypothetical protein [Streptococcus pyogenes]QCK41086.1 hypothetical protein ETT64_07350 [Streptococcus pyogenes]VGT98756.1 hypothetical membrane associated protein [Streptococcus pyogenes]HEX0002575.1 hypothetical protein [Streptococcus pyogenes]